MGWLPGHVGKGALTLAGWWVLPCLPPSKSEQLFHGDLSSEGRRTSTTPTITSITHPPSHVTICLSIYPLIHTSIHLPTHACSPFHLLTCPSTTPPSPRPSVLPASHPRPCLQHLPLAWCTQVLQIHAGPARVCCGSPAGRTLRWVLRPC